MIKVLVIAPYIQLYEQYDNCIKRLCGDKKDIEFSVGHIKGTKDSFIKECRADIVIARGITGMAFREKLPQAHFIDIEVTGYDIFNAIMECRKRYNAKKIAIVGTNSVLCDIESLNRFSGASLQLFRVADETDISRALEKGRQMGVDAFVGGKTAYKMCEETGQNCVAILTGNEALETSVRLAVDAAESISKERSKKAIMKKVLNSTKNGIIALDKYGNIEEINQRAKEFFEIPEEKRGEDIDINNIFPTGEWREVIKNGTEQDVFCKINDMLYVVAMAPLETKGEPDGILMTIQNAQSIRETETKIRSGLKMKGFSAKYTFEDIIGESEAVKKNILMAKKYSSVDSSVLIVGETGTGKELFAHSIHNFSGRSDEPFVAINCAAVPENLLESELFGYSEGAFSGAVRGGKTGLFEIAHKGTIFLDEIGEMPINLQAKLLRVLEEREIRRVGDSKIIPIDVRVISATNINIDEKIAEGKFRSDLFYRLNLLDIRLAPLRQRREDIPALAVNFIRKFAVRIGRPFIKIDALALEELKKPFWAGNIRELKNICERLAVLCENGIISREDVTALNIIESRAVDRFETAEQRRIRKEDIAKAMGISRTTLWRRSKEDRRNN